MKFPNFVGPAYQSQSQYISADELINLYLERYEAADGKNLYSLLKRPGYREFAQITTPTLACPVNQPVFLAPYSGQVVVTGGTAPYAFNISAGALPAGLTLDVASGLITGTPTVFGLYNWTVQVIDGNGFSNSIACQSVIPSTGGPITITSGCPTLQPVIGTPYSAFLTVTGGTSPYTWSISAGALPDGLTLDSSTGEISGTPTTSGDFSYTARVTDVLMTFAEITCSMLVPCPGFAGMIRVIIDHTQIPASQTDFPFLISLTDNRLKHTSFGGLVTSLSGFDVRPKDSASSCSDLVFELEDGGYDPATGTILMHVLLPAVISSSVDGKFYLAFGNGALVTDASNDDVWTGYPAVLHQNVIGAGSTGTRNSASLPQTINNVWGNENVTTTPAQIGNGGSYNGSNCSLNGNPTAETDPFFANLLLGTGDFTVSAWVKTSSNAYMAVAARKNSLICAFGSTGSYWELAINGGLVRFDIRNTGASPAQQVVTSMAAVNDGLFHFITVTRVGVTVKIYIDGILDTTNVGSATIDLVNDGGTHYFGRTSSNTCLNWLNGIGDEFRVHKTIARSPEWIAIEFANQKTGSTLASYV